MRLRVRLWIWAYKLNYSALPFWIAGSRALARVTEMLQDGLTYDEANDAWNGEPAERL
jgi:hypothetical protein